MTTTIITIKSFCLITGANRAEIERIKSALTLKNPKYIDALKYGRSTADIEKYFTCYKETVDGVLEVPRGFVDQAREILGECEMKDQTRLLDPVLMTFRGDLRGKQAQCLENISKYKHCVLQLPTGAGKTVVAIAMVAKRKQRALIIVHRKELMYQWKDKIEQFLGVVPGLVGDGHKDVRPITIAIVNSAKNQVGKLKSQFGVVIIDECHHCPARTFTEVLINFDSRYLLGLTATPERRDRLHPITNFYLGPTICCGVNHEDDDSLGPECAEVKTDFYYDGFGYSNMITALVNNDRRNRQIVAVTEKCLRRGSVLVVSDRVSHCEILEEMLRRGGHNPRVLTSRTKNNVRKHIVDDVKSGKVKILLSTASLIGEGFDAPELASLVLATPVGSVPKLKQLVGRIMRCLPGKKPLVVDFIDEHVRLLQKSICLRRQELRNVA